MNKIFIFLLIFFTLCNCSQVQSPEEEGKLKEMFQNPPESSKSWVLWDWINCNVSREGITKDMESMKELGIGGVVWRGLAGPWWAPGSPQITPYSPEWHDHMQWAIKEAERRLILSSAEKIKELVESGARIIAQKRITGTPGLSGLS